MLNPLSPYSHWNLGIPIALLTDVILGATDKLMLLETVKDS